MTVGVALFGYGLAGAFFHAPLIVAEPRLRLARMVTSRAAEVHRTFPGLPVTRDHQPVLSDPAVDLVVIATPNHTHAALARDALLAGKHVVIDKPFVTDLADGADLIELARTRGRMLSVFLNRRWDGDFRTVERLTDEERLGSIALASMHWDRFRPAVKHGWREVPGEGTGLLADLGPHLVDQALRLFGCPQAIQGDVMSQRADALVDDYFEITLHYGEQRVVVGASSLIAQPRPRFAIHGKSASFVKHGVDPQEARLRAGGSVRDADYGLDAPADYGILADAHGTQPIATERGDWRHFYAGVADAMLDGKVPPVDPAEALAGLSILDCARRSAREGRLLRFNPPLRIVEGAPVA